MNPFQAERNQSALDQAASGMVQKSTEVDCQGVGQKGVTETGSPSISSGLVRVISGAVAIKC